MLLGRGVSLTHSPRVTQSASVYHSRVKQIAVLDNKEYKTIDDDVFTQARLLEITDIDIYRYLADKAFGTPEPNKDSVPKLCRSTTIKTTRRQFLTSCLAIVSHGMRYEKRGTQRRVRP